MEIGIGIAGTTAACLAVGWVAVGLIVMGGAAVAVATSGFVSLTGDGAGGRGC